MPQTEASMLFFNRERMSSANGVAPFGRENKHAQPPPTRPRSLVG